MASRRNSTQHSLVSSTLMRAKATLEWSSIARWTASQPVPVALEGRVRLPAPTRQRKDEKQTRLPCCRRSWEATTRRRPATAGPDYLPLVGKRMHAPQLAQHCQLRRCKLVLFRCFRWCSGWLCRHRMAHWRNLWRRLCGACLGTWRSETPERLVGRLAVLLPASLDSQATWPSRRPGSATSCAARCRTFKPTAGTTWCRRWRCSRWSRMP